MDNPPEVTRAQMDATRAAISAKLAALEQRMVDIRHRVDRHPWALVGGSIALGLMGGYLLLRHVAAQRAAIGYRPPVPADTPAAAEIARLKRLAIGTLLSVVRDRITRSAPEPLHAGLTEAIDGITLQLGGEPIRGPVY